MKTIEITYRYGGEDATPRARPADAEAARERLDEGSRSIASLFSRMVEGAGTVRRVISVDPREWGVDTGVPGAPRQRPYAAVLGCSDARVPVELIFNEGPNDLFVVRVAGNGLGGEVLGSLRYAVDHLAESMKLVVVLGHSGCGAVSAAVDVFLKPEGYLELAANHALRGILDRLLVVVNAAARRMAALHGADVAQCPGYRAALVESAVVANAALCAHSLQQHVGGSAAGLRAVYGVYLLESREIWAPRCDGPQTAGLAYPPADLAQFAEFANAVVESARIAAMLARPAP